MTLSPVVKDGLQHDRVKVTAREVVLQPLAMVIDCSIAVTNVGSLPVHAVVLQSLACVVQQIYARGRNS